MTVWVEYLVNMDGFGAGSIRKVSRREADRLVADKLAVVRIYPESEEDRRRKMTSRKHHRAMLDPVETK